MVEQETEVPPSQMPLQISWSYNSLFQSRQYVHLYFDSAMAESFNLISALPSAKRVLYEMIQLPQFLWVLHALRVDTYLYTRPIYWQ